MIATQGDYVAGRARSDNPEVGRHIRGEGNVIPPFGEPTCRGTSTRLGAKGGVLLTKGWQYVIILPIVETNKILVFLQKARLTISRFTFTQHRVILYSKTQEVCYGA